MPPFGESHDVLPEKSSRTDHKQFLPRHLVPCPNPFLSFQIPGRSRFRVTRAPRVRRLERISKRELHPAIVDRGRKDLPLGRIADDVIRCSKVRMVEGVERIRAELELLPLGDAERFGE